jgi:dimethylhistidine N-methyltransferase
VTQGLLDTQKSLPCKYLYDAKGAELFERITETDVYYPTRIETALLQEHAAEIARCLPDGFRWIELGAGSAKKSEVLLRTVGKGTFVPIDISERQLRETAARLRLAFPQLEVSPLAVDFERPFVLPAADRFSRTMVSLLGATIGAFEPLDATRMLRRLSRLAGPNGAVLIGIDRKKDPALLQSAANDPGGLTALLHLNLLHRLNAELGSDIVVDRFKHHGFYDPVRGCVEMHLVSRVEQRVRIGDHTIMFDQGESIRTERAYKYTPAQFRGLARSAGLVHLQTFSDRPEWYSLMLFGANSD